MKSKRRRRPHAAQSPRLLALSAVLMGCFYSPSSLPQCTTQHRDAHVHSHTQAAHLSNNDTPLTRYISNDTQPRRNVYWPRPSLCLSVCSVPRCIPTLLHGPGCHLGEWYGCPLVVHYWVGSQSVHGFRCHDNVHEKYIPYDVYTANA